MLFYSNDFLTREREGRFRVAIFGIVGKIDLELDVIPEIGQIYLRTFSESRTHVFVTDFNRDDEGNGINEDLKIDDQKKIVNLSTEFLQSNIVHFRTLISS